MNISPWRFLPVLGDGCEETRRGWVSRTPQFPVLCLSERLRLDVFSVGLNQYHALGQKDSPDKRGAESV